MGFATLGLGEFFTSLQKALDENHAFFVDDDLERSFYL